MSFPPKVCLYRSQDDIKKETKQIIRFARKGERLTKIHIYRLGLEAVSKLKTLVQPDTEEPCIICGAAGGHDEGCTVGLLHKVTETNGETSLEVN